MNLADQVCSLELSKRLKELGVKQDSYFQWFVDEISNYSFIVSNNSIVNSQRKYPEKYSAFTVAELGEMLPLGCESSGKEKAWLCRYLQEPKAKNCHTMAETEADARAKMLIYLIENGLVKL